MGEVEGGVGRDGELGEDLENSDHDFPVRKALPQLVGEGEEELGGREEPTGVPGTRQSLLVLREYLGPAATLAL